MCRWRCRVQLRYAHVPSSTLAAGSTPTNHVNAALAALAPYGITAGYLAALGSTALSRGKVMYGMTRDILRTITRTYGVSWSIVNGQLQLVDLNSYAPGDAVVLNSATGLIGMPRQEPDGIHVRCLLNPNIVATRLLQIDNASVTQYLGQAGAIGDVRGQGRLPSIADDGIYKSILVDHVGDTRGQEWYTDIICLSNSGSFTPEALKGVLAPTGGSA